MKKYINFFIPLGVLFVLIVCVHSCKLKSIDPAAVDIGYNFCPLEIGRYITYDEYDTIYDPTKEEDTLYHVKELINDTIMEGTEVKFVIYRFVKKTTDSLWPIQPDSVWTYVNDGHQLIREESNVEYIKIAFPVQEGKIWNGNALNTYSDQTSIDKYYQMINLDQPYVIGSSKIPLTFSQTLKIVISNQADPIVSKDIRYDVFARGVGLIKKDYTQYYYKQDPSYPPQTIDYGSRKIMLITGYGKQ